MKLAAAFVVLLLVIAFCAGVMAVDIAVERYKRWRLRKDAFVPDYTVGAFRGVQDQKKW